MNYVSVEGLSWPFTYEEKEQMRCDLNITTHMMSDAFILALLYPFYKNARKTFIKNLSEFDEIKRRLNHQHTEYYFLYKGKPYYLDKKPETVLSASIEMVIEDKYLAILDEISKQFEKISSDYDFLSLWARLSFSQALKKDNMERVIFLQKYTSPMLLKSTALSPLLEDLEKYERPKDDPVLERAERILTFYIGFNLVCNT